MAKQVCENCSEYSPDSLDTDVPMPSDCYGIMVDDEETERLIEVYFESGKAGCPSFKLRPELRLRERIFGFYYAWREIRFYRKVMDEEKVSK